MSKDVYMGAGILPTTVHDGRIWFLFGKENKYADTPGFSDIGGGTDNNETLLETAIREGTEELTGFLGSEQELGDMLRRGTYNIDFKTTSKNGGVYRMHLFPYEYEPMLPVYYNNNANFIDKKLDPKIIQTSKIFEKSEIRWICIDDLLKMRSQFRSYFQPHLDVIISQKSDIERFIKGKMRGLTNSSSRSSRSRSRRSRRSSRSRSTRR